MISIPLFNSIAKDDINSVRYLIEHGADVNFYWSEYRCYGHFITFAANNNQIEILKLLIKYGANVNDSLVCLKNKEPLIKSKTIKFLIENGAEFSKYLHRCMDDPKLLKFMLNKIKLVENDKILQKMISKVYYCDKKYDIMDALIDHGIKLSYFIKNAKMEYFSKEYKMIIDLFLAKGANINEKDSCKF